MFFWTQSAVSIHFLLFLFSSESKGHALAWLGFDTREGGMARIEYFESLRINAYLSLIICAEPERIPFLCCRMGVPTPPPKFEGARLGRIRRMRSRRVPV